MKLLKIISFGRRAAAGLLFFVIVAGARGASTNAPATGKGAVTGTNAAPTELTVPKSVFELTATPTKDPFFPLSMRQPVPTATNVMAFSASSFTLKGLSGSPGHRLALINNRTMADGETTEISTPSGKVKIHCIKIKDASVVIRASTQADPIEIFLRKAAQ
jgi:hypothetical protein